MKSLSFDLKDKAIRLRKLGKSIVFIERKLKISRSTLSGWFKKVVLTERQKNNLRNNSKKALASARKKAVIWHNNEKIKRIIVAENEAKYTLKFLDQKNKNVLDLALAMLYLGEGFKKSDETAIGNSDPKILKFFIAILNNNYNLNLLKIKCELHLRADQNINKMKEYWSKELRIPIENFTTVSIDSRTVGKKTYSTYKGVCVLRCGTVAIQRKLVFISKMFCDRVIGSFYKGG